MPVDDVPNERPTDAAIVVDGLSMVYGPGAPRALPLLSRGETKEEILEQTGLTVAVRNACFRVYCGEIFVVMGVSGCGKSTLLQLINGLVEPTAGSVHVLGRNVTRMRPAELVRLRRYKLSMVFQSFALFPHLNVLDNVAFGLDVAGLSKAERHRRAVRALEAVDLRSEDAGRSPGDLSSGEQQLVGLARALAVGPTVVLMDEPFSVLDPLKRNEMQKKLRALQRGRGLTIMFVTHDLDEAMAVGDRVAMMDAGRIVQVGSPEDVMERPANDDVAAFVGRHVERSHRPAPPKTDKL